MSDSSNGGRVLYRDLIPYETPESLDQLRGPRHGTIRLPLHIHWGPDPAADLDTPGGREKAYASIIQEGRSIDQTELLNRDLLLEIWPDLWVARRCRQLWEAKFPELTGPRAA